MIRQVTPVVRVQALTVYGRYSAIIDAIHAQYGCPNGEGPGVATLECYKKLFQIQVLPQMFFCTAAPVIKVTGYDQRFVVRNVGIYSLGERSQLLPSFSFQQPHVNTECVKWSFLAWDIDDAM